MSSGSMNVGSGWLRGATGAVVCALLVVSFPLVAQAQVAGDTTQEVRSVTFTVNETDLRIDPTPQTGQKVSKTYPISEAADDIGDDIGAGFLSSMFSAMGIDLNEACLFGVCVLDLLAVFTGNPLDMPLAVDAQAGGYFEVVDVTGTDVSINYPLDVTLVYPAANTFRCGQTITVETSCALAAGSSPSMDIAPPFYDTTVGLLLRDITIALSPSFCMDAELFEICVPQDFGWDPKIPLPGFDEALVLDAELYTVCSEGVGTDDIATWLSCGGGLLPDLISSFAFNVDPGPDGGICAEPHFLTPVPEMETCFREPLSGELVFALAGACNEDLVLTRQGTALDILTLSTDVVSWADEILCKLPYPLSCTEIDFGEVIIDPIDISPSMFVDQEMRFELEPTVFLSLNLATPAGHAQPELRVTDPATNAVVWSGTGPAVRLKAGHHLEVDFPQTLRDEIAVGPTYEVEADLTVETKHHYSMGVETKLGEVIINGTSVTPPVVVPAVREPLVGSPVLIEDHTLAVGDLFAPVVGAGFSLDPEKPIIDITRLSVEDVRNLGGGERAVVYRIDLRNSGDVKLFEIESEFDLGAIYATAEYFEVLCVHSDDLIVDPAYDGASVINLLDPASTLQVGQESTIEVLVKVKPEVAEILPDGCFAPVEYYASGKARAVSPIGTHIENNFNPCTGERTGDDFVAAVDLGAAIIDGLEDYAVYGWDRVVFARAFELSRGNAGSGGMVKFLPLTAQVSNDPRIIGDIHLGRDLHVSQSHVTLDYAQVAGRIFMNDPNSSLTTTGTISQPTECAALFSRPDLSIPNVVGSAVVDVAMGNSASPVPGSYKRFALAEGSQLTLSAGEYTVGLLRITGDDASILFDTAGGPIILNLNDWRMLPVENAHFALADASLSTRDVQINYAGKKKQIFRGGLVQGNLLAPEAEIVFTVGGALEGTCYAERVQMGPYSQFTYHDYLEDLNIHEACQGGSGEGPGAR